jgi:DNA polymerase (family 10)
MDNDEIAAVFYEIADLLELQGIAFKPQAYRRAARNIEQLEEPVDSLMKEGKLEEIPGIGKAITKKIEELVGTGELRYLAELRAEVPEGLVEMLSVPDVGPKTAMILHKELGISSVQELKEAATAHRLRGLKGFGERTEERILAGIRTLESRGGRTLLGEALPVAEAYVSHLRAHVSSGMIDIAGSLRRGRDTIGDIDILVGEDDPSAAIEAFLAYPEVDDVLASGSTKSSVRLASGLQVDLRAVAVKSYGAALQYFTGSKEHNVTLRGIGVKQGLKLNEYGLFERDTEKMVAGATEEEVYRALGMDWIPPELREDSGEIAAAQQGKLPDLVRLEDIRGDLHGHSDWSDGRESVEEIVAAARGRGMEYIAITDHSESLRIANGLSPERLKEQTRLVREVDASQEGFIRVLAGSEVDIKADGSLDMPREVLRDLDIVIGSVHSRFKMPSREMTERICKAISSGYIDILGHPTGRLIGQRSPYEFDLRKVLETASEHSVAMEINSFPDRLDLRDVDCRAAKEMGVKLAINTDYHSSEHMEFIRYGVITARRGWLEAEDVLNTKDVDGLLKMTSGRRG